METMINCVFAERVAQDVTECRNDKSHIYRACNAFCTRCRVRVPLDRADPPAVNRAPACVQMTVEEWLKGGTN